MTPRGIDSQFGRHSLNRHRPPLFPSLGLELRLVAPCGCYRTWDPHWRETFGPVVCATHRHEPWAPVRRRSGARSESWGT